MITSRLGVVTAAICLLLVSVLAVWPLALPHNGAFLGGSFAVLYDGLVGAVVAAALSALLALLITRYVLNTTLKQQQSQHDAQMLQARQHHEAALRRQVELHEATNELNSRQVRVVAAIGSATRLASASRRVVAAVRRMQSQAEYMSYVGRGGLERFMDASDEFRMSALHAELEDALADALTALAPGAEASTVDALEHLYRLIQCFVRSESLSRSPAGAVGHHGGLGPSNSRADEMNFRVEDAQDRLRLIIAKCRVATE